ncbi:N-acetylmuramoyl-L-alanine amidase [Salinicoccus halitifaciens]|uniref:N-acetylmuramoyl-L-alanine amidase n=1 Tax=Salinicoccus halitifaciens TaxID=1073415 RepID=A0ABV2E5T2_9STAP|nr:N-acetylmuramoyl-L-alanine amidase [Salinicoccus halitifaciens]
MSYKIVNMWVSPSKYNIKATYAMSPTTITIHNTANVAPARNEVAYMRNNNNMTSYHVAIDDKEVVQAIPFNRNSWAAGDGLNGTGNRRSIHIEICYSMDNGYSGAYSNRYAQAEENTALYTAYVLHQYGWGVNRLRQHYDWSRKDCPHKMRAHGRWNAFKNRVQAHLNAIKKGNTSATKKTTTKKKTTQKAKGSTYTVKSGDSLWAISKASGVSVANLKSWNNLSSNTIHVGQNLSLKKPAKKSTKKKSSKGKGTGGVKNIRYHGDWRYNSNTGAYWVPVTVDFIVGDQPIYAYEHVPKRIHRAPSMAKAGARIKVVELCRCDGHVWAVYRTGSGRLRYLPIKKWNGKGGRVTNKGLFGYFSKAD